MLCNIIRTWGVSIWNIEEEITIGLTLGMEYSHNWSWEYCFVQGFESFFENIPPSSRSRPLIKRNILKTTEAFSLGQTNTLERIF
jgi:hypothetical protein